MIEKCPACGGHSFRDSKVLWAELIEEWALSEGEVAYIDRQQGFSCETCGNNLRSMVLAKAILSFLGCKDDELLSSATSKSRYGSLRILEINEAGLLTSFLKAFPKHRLISYPDADMTNLPFPDDSWDLVIHSDTLEHIPDPVQGLKECHRILKKGGACIFTVPIIVGRMTRSRDGLKASYHGNSSNPADYRVVTEFGADVWTSVLVSGFETCKMHHINYPNAIAIEAMK